MKSLVIRNLVTIADLEVVRKLEALIWSLEDSVPVNQTVAAVKNGGLVIGAFLTDKLVGFQYSFPGYDGEKIYLCSHSLGIHPDFQKMGIGEKLKLAQKTVAIEKGYDLITWTYDPLETVNGYLNLHKLGAVCSTYLENAYGEMDDNLNAGIPTDRFLVEWKIKEQREVAGSYQPAPKISTLEHIQHDDVLFVPVPGNFQELKRDHFSHAQKWRARTREIFTYYFRLGYSVVDLIKDHDVDRQYLYVLKKG
ncbi:GNAT family N-acetyltransferase [Anaerobacillus alkaliphilus]|uniref:GNAT family N-acetyltransferase n=1 Tax=Anaerobacillus alkaliphilus TaxID=1548597 RepID=A0A4Q0VMD5_9BACI|nr:GNAT family N-acetyltransferase [Anaerobacillus alkaliphilus]RXI96488.1 GNAT family N-acetyltransferase [Anaerobacillus alkaliphilus]